MTTSPIPQQLALLSLTGLMPCPFCGMVTLSSVSYQPPDATPKPLCIQCETCGATGPIAASHDQLRALWDVRAAIGRPA